MRRQLSSHFCPGKVPPCTYCSVHVISFLPRHPAGTYPLECPFHRYIRAPQVLVTIRNTYQSLLDLLPTIPDQTHRPWKHPGRSKQKDQIRQPELGCKTQMLVSVHHHI